MNIFGSRGLDAMIAAAVKAENDRIELACASGALIGQGVVVIRGRYNRLIYVGNSSLVPPGTLYEIRTEEM